ncbi:MAG: hypothetical protein QXW47_09970 [Candidatus Jordarchaeales archaeon]
MCLACLNMITKIYPSIFGVKYNFESTSIIDVLWEKSRAER